MGIPSPSSSGSGIQGKGLLPSAIRLPRWMVEQLKGLGEIGYVVESRLMSTDSDCHWKIEILEKQSETIKPQHKHHKEPTRAPEIHDTGRSPRSLPPYTTC